MVVFVFDIPVFSDQTIGLRCIHFVVGDVISNFTPAFVYLFFGGKNRCEKIFANQILE